jgi:hypothetical protein
LTRTGPLVCQRAPDPRQHADALTPPSRLTVVEQLAPAASPGSASSSAAAPVTPAPQSTPTFMARSFPRGAERTVVVLSRLAQFAITEGTSASPTSRTSTGARTSGRLGTSRLLAAPDRQRTLPVDLAYLVSSLSPRAGATSRQDGRPRPVAPAELSFVMRVRCVPSASMT